jgi:hypothetical protein
MCDAEELVLPESHEMVFRVENPDGFLRLRGGYESAAGDLLRQAVMVQS